MTSSSTKKVTMPLPTGSLIKYFHRKFTSKVEWKMGYNDLAYFMLLEEDNSCKPSLEVLKEDYFTLRDLQGCKLSGNFFKIFCNLNKFMVFESRDPFLIRQEREDPSLTQWDSFAHRVYMAFDGRRW